MPYQQKNSKKPTTYIINGRSVSGKNKKFTLPKKLGFIKNKIVIFFLVFGIIGGGYLVYRSFAFNELVRADGDFIPLSPVRILDTRNGTGGIQGAVGQTPATIQITGRGGVPTSGVKAVVMNVTVTGGTADSFLTVWPSGIYRPTVSNINFTAGQTIPNQVTVAVGADGKVKAFNNAGSVHVIFDIAGYYSDANGSLGTRYHSLTPSRVLDTRGGQGWANGPIGQSATQVQITGRGGVPTSGVKAVVMNVTVTGATQASNLTIWPSGVVKPVVSNLNFNAGQTIANTVTVMVGEDGKLLLSNNSGTTHVLFDVVGYYSPNETGYERTQAGRFATLKPTRVYDSRSATGGMLVAGIPRYIDVSSYVKQNVDGNDIGVEKSRIESVVLNVTATSPTSNSFLTLWPTGSVRPETSNLNFTAGQTIANQVITRMGSDGRVAIYNNSGNTHFIIDIVGYVLKDPDTVEVTELHSVNIAQGNQVQFSFVYNNYPTNPDYKMRFDVDFGTANYLGLGFITNGANGEQTIDFACKIGPACVLPDPNTRVLQPSGSSIKYATLPYNLVKGINYTVYNDIVSNEPGYPGTWVKLSITGQDGVKKVLALEQYSTRGGDLPFPLRMLNSRISGSVSCGNPQALDVTLKDIRVDGKVQQRQDDTLITAVNYDDAGLGCPGISKVVRLSSGDLAVNYNVGIPKATRAVTPPTINSISSNLSDKSASATITSNDQIIGAKASIDGVFIKRVPIDPWGQGWILTDSPTVAKFTWADKTFSAGVHILSIQAIDNSGNVAEKTSYITL